MVKRQRNPNWIVATTALLVVLSGCKSNSSPRTAFVPHVDSSADNSTQANGHRAEMSNGKITLFFEWNGKLTVSANDAPPRNWLVASAAIPAEISAMPDKFAAQMAADTNSLSLALAKLPEYLAERLRDENDVDRQHFATFARDCIQSGRISFQGTFYGVAPTSISQRLSRADSDLLQKALGIK